jgi:hypothetical protein
MADSLVGRGAEMAKMTGSLRGFSAAKRRQARAQMVEELEFFEVQIEKQMPVGTNVVLVYDRNENSAKKQVSLPRLASVQLVSDLTPLGCC